MSRRKCGLSKKLAEPSREISVLARMVHLQLRRVEPNRVAGLRALTRAATDVAYTVPPPDGETISLKNPPARRIIEANLGDLSRRLYAWVPPEHIFITVKHWHLFVVDNLEHFPLLVTDYRR